ncbi:hypothetical protein J5681_03390 [bacterium]|nr:hypothetical protein [bacterium]
MSKIFTLTKIANFITKYGIQNTNIRKDINYIYVIDVDGNVNLSNKNLTDPDMTAKFGKVTGNFECKNNELTSLDFAPEFVGGVFDCSSNNINNFDNIPIKHVDGNFYAYGADPDKLSKLKGIVKGEIYPSH